MEYGINKKIKYTTSQIISILVKGNERKTTKMAPTRIPPRGMGNGLERAYIQRMTLLQRLQYQSTDKTELSWSLYRLKPRYYSLYKKFTNYVTKERPLGGFERSKIHFGQQLPLFSVRPDK